MLKEMLLSGATMINNMTVTMQGVDVGCQPVMGSNALKVMRCKLSLTIGA